MTAKEGVSACVRMCARWISLPAVLSPPTRLVLGFMNMLRFCARIAHGLGVFARVSVCARVHGNAGKGVCLPMVGVAAHKLCMLLL